MSKQTENKKFSKGVGLNLRLSFLEEFLKQKPPVAFLEIIAENLFTGGSNLDKVVELSKNYSIVLHCVGMNIGGVDPLNSDYFKKISLLIDKLNPILVSDHLCFQKHNNFYHHDLLPIPLNPKSAQHCAERIKIIQNKLHRPIAVENLSYYVEYDSSEYMEAEMLSMITEKSQCKLLVDLNNYEINEKNFQSSFLKQWSYIDPKTIAEFHVAGGELISDTWVDTHGGVPSTESLDFLQKLEGKEDYLICFERDQKSPPFEQLLQIHKSIENHIYA